MLHESRMLWTSTERYVLVMGAEIHHVGARGLLLRRSNTSISHKSFVYSAQVLFYIITL